MSSGFPSWNRLQKDVKDLRQLYDITSHLYSEEHTRLGAIKRSGVDGDHSLLTSAGLVTHNVQGLYERTKNRYPERLRSLLLVALVTHLEGFVTDLVGEIAERTLDPFHTDERREYSTRQLLSFPSARFMQEELIQSDRRKLTSGGFKEIRKYYRRRFDIAFADMGVPYDQVVELHDRRHLHVHRGGISDAQYAREHSALGFGPGDYVPVEQAYLLKAFELTLSFGGALRNEAIARYPEFTRRKRNWVNPHPPQDPAQILLLRIEAQTAAYDPISHLPPLITGPPSARPRPLVEHLCQVIVEEREALVFLGGTPQELRKVLYTLKRQDAFLVRSISQVG